MRLAEYVDAGKGRQTELASKVGCQPQLVWQWSRGVRPVPHERCPEIELATEGQVTCEELRSDLRWVRVACADWPHADGKPMLDVAPLAVPKEPEQAERA